jgi:hypothetical protein
MNAYEIEQLEKQMRAEVRLALPYAAWAEIARSARQERARFVGKMMADFFAGAFAKLMGAARQIRSTAAACTGARLRHDH